MNKQPTQRQRGRIWTAGTANPLVEDGILEVADGLISAVRPAADTDPPPQLDQYGQPYTFLPGMVDLHNHGGAGHSFPTSDAAGCRAAVKYHRTQGTTTQLASLVSANPAELISQSAVLAELAADGDIAGIHLEGPFLNAVRCGAQDPDALRPGDPDLLRAIAEAAGGYLRSITIAPETERFQQLIEVCAEHAVLASLGHSDASAAQTEAAMAAIEEAGVGLTATHLFNGMPGMHHRDPGITGSLLRAASQGRLQAELIADGVHLHDTTVDIVLAAAPGHVAFVSDAMAAAGVGDGAYTLGGSAVTVDNGIARLQGPAGQAGSIAGGTASLIDQLLRHSGPALLARSIGSEKDSEDAVRTLRACTRTPADVLHLYDRGELATGLRADVVTLDSAGTVASVLVEGVEQ